MPYTYEYERPSITVDLVVLTIIDGELSVLLVKRKNDPYGNCWALPGGFMHMDESPEAAALRELREETSVDGIGVEQLGAYGDVERDPRTRVVTIAFYALVPHDKVRNIVAGDDASDAVWRPVRDGTGHFLAFDHDVILYDAICRLRRDVYSCEAGRQFLGMEFTLTALQRTYEAILNKRLDVRNFRRKIENMGIVRPVGRSGAGAGRPSMLFSFQRAPEDRMVGAKDEGHRQQPDRKAKKRKKSED